MSDGSAENLQAAAISFENVLASVYPITFSCYTSIFEFGDTADYYMSTFTDVN